MKLNEIKAATKNWNQLKALAMRVKDRDTESENIQDFAIELAARLDSALELWMGSRKLRELAKLVASGKRVIVYAGDTHEDRQKPLALHTLHNKMQAPDNMTPRTRKAAVIAKMEAKGYKLFATEVNYDQYEMVFVQR